MAIRNTTCNRSPVEGIHAANVRTHNIDGHCITGSSIGAARPGLPADRRLARVIHRRRGGPESRCGRHVEFVVNRWSSDADRDRLMTVMFDKGPGEVADALQEMPRMGYIRAPGRIGWDIRFARHMLGAGGRRARRARCLIAAWAFARSPTDPHHRAPSRLSVHGDRAALAEER